MTVNRRRFLQLGAASTAVALWPSRARAATYRVGVGRDAAAYNATRRAIDASAEWPAARIAGRTVVIKPNLVSPRTADTGAVTDPEVVRALVDRALADGAAAVRIVEGSPNGALFTYCGYDFFNSYDPGGRVRLVDLANEPYVLAPLANAFAYPAVWLPSTILGDQLVFISAAKMKTHADAVMSLSLKNLFGLPAVDRYLSYAPVARLAMHDRSVHQTIVDLARLRPIDFAVIDGVWAMEGAGPLRGTPIELDLVLAGQNAVAVDRIALAAVSLPQRAVRHLDYAASVGLGPADVGEITVAGDPLAPRAIQMARFPPFVEYPRVLPAAFDPAAGGRTLVGVWYAQACLRQLDILRLYDDRPQVDLIRTLGGWTTKDAGYEFVGWDGRAEDGSLVPPGLYAAHVRAFNTTADGRPTDGIGWVRILGPR